MECPHCRKTVEEGNLACPLCGVNFAKWGARAAAPREAVPGAVVHPGAAPGRFITVAASMRMVVLGLGSLWAGLAGMGTLVSTLGSAWDCLFGTHNRGCDVTALVFGLGCAFGLALLSRHWAGRARGMYMISAGRVPPPPAWLPVTQEAAMAASPRPPDPQATAWRPAAEALVRFGPSKTALGAAAAVLASVGGCFLGGRYIEGRADSAAAGFVIFFAAVYVLVIALGVFLQSALYWHFTEGRHGELAVGLRRAAAAKTAASTPMGIILFTSLWALFAGCTAIFVPKFMEVGRSGEEGALKGRLGSIRSALSIYYGDMEGLYPEELSALAVSGKYLSEIPAARGTYFHAGSNAVQNGATPTDRGGWLYDNIPGDANLGSIWVDCTHTDTKGTVWAAY